MKICYNHLLKYCNKLPQEEVEVYSALEDLGIEIKKITKIDDSSVITLELLANRGDHHCYLGIARELSAKFESSLKFPEIYTGDVLDLKLQNFKIPSICYGISIFKIDDLNNYIDTPNEIKKVINANNENSKNFLDDVIKYVSYEIGQPTLGIDLEKIKGNLDIIILEKDLLIELEEKEKPIYAPQGTLCIADSLGPIALLGIGVVERVKINSSTKKIYIVSGLYEPTYIRKISKEMNIKNHSTTILERGGDLSLVEKAPLRVLKICQNNKVIASGSKIEKFTNLKIDFKKSLKIDFKKVDEYYNYNFNLKETINKLKLLGFIFNNEENIINIPSHRWWDINNIEDIYEEIGRITGYDTFPANDISISPVKYEEEDISDRFEDMLVGHGFLEVITDSFYGKGKFSLLDLSSESRLNEHVELVNSVDKNFSLMKNNSIVNILDLVKYNLNFNIETAKVFEITKLFFKEEKDYSEKKILWGAIWGEENFGRWRNISLALDFWYMKGVIEDLFKFINIKLEYKPFSNLNKYHALMHPKKSVSIIFNDKEIGLIGAIHPFLLKKWGIDTNKEIFMFEIDLELIEKIGKFEKENIPEHMSIVRNISLHLPLGIKYSDIVNLISTHTQIPIEKVELSDLFIEGDIRSYTFEVSFYNDNKTKSEVINEQIIFIKEKILKEYQDKGLYLR